MKRLLVVVTVLCCLLSGSGCERSAARLQGVAKAGSEIQDQSPFSMPAGVSDGEILFQDDFEDGNLEGWQSTTTWLVQKADSNSVLVATGSGQAAWVPAGLGWTDYYFRAGVRLESGGVGLAFRASRDGRYWLYYTEKSLALLKESPKGNFTLLQQTAAPPLKTGQALAIGGYGGHLQVYVGKTLQMDYVDPTPIQRGTIGIGVTNDGRVAVDNVAAVRLRSDPAGPSASQSLPATLPPPAQPPAAGESWQSLGEWLPEEEAAPLVQPTSPPGGGWAAEEEPAPLVQPTSPPGGEWMGEEEPEAPPAVEEPSAPIQEPPGGGAQPAGGLPVIDYFYAEPVQGEPGCYYLHWDLHNAESAYLNGQGITAPGSGQTCEAGTFTLRAQNAQGSVERSLTITPQGEIQEEAPPAPPESGQPPEGEQPPPPPEGGGTAGLPDLIVQDATVWVPDAAQPNFVRGRIVIVNIGDVTSPAYTVRWFPHRNSDVVGYAADGAPLEVGRRAEFTFSYTYPQSGDMHWGVRVDPDNEVAESDETNNTGGGQVHIERQSAAADQGSVSAPNLVIGNVAVTFPDAQNPLKAQAQITVMNSGNKPASLFAAEWYPTGAADTVGCHKLLDTGLPAGGQQQFTCQYTYSAPGNYTWRVVADPANDVPNESNESDNSVTGTAVARAAPASPQPDLAIVSAHFEPSPVIKGQPFKAVVTVKNIGLGATTTSVRVRWHFHASLGVEDCGWELGPVSNGQGDAFSCTRTTNAGPGQVPTEVTIDANNVVAEPDEANNDVSLTMEIVAVSSDHPDAQGVTRPDLLIKNLRVVPSKAIPGQELTISFDVVNQGAAAPASKALWHSGASGQQAIVRDVPALGPGASHHIDITGVAAPANPGNYSHYAMADSASLIDEENENNNKLVGAESLVVMASDHPDVQGPPDLVVRNLKIIPNPVTHGKEFQVEFEVVNQGAGTAAASVAEWRTAPAGGLSFRCNVPKLDKGASHRCTWQFPSAPAKKNYGTTAIADVDKTINESSEDNNSVKVTLQVK